MYRGTLEIVTEENEDYFQVVSEYEIELMIERIIPSHKKFPLRVRVHPENTQMIRMIMKEYPFEIKTDRWEEVQQEIVKLEDLKKSVENLDYVEPEEGHFIGELLPFQKQGLDFILKTNGRTLITDEMGLGKTIETIAFLSKKNDAFPVVIVAPLTTLINWKREIERFLRLDHPVSSQQKKLNQDENHIPKIQIIREGKPRKLSPADIYIINYDIVRKRIKDLVNVNPRTTVYDECQYLRNDDTARYGSCRMLALHNSVKYRLGLSGTPIYNKGLEMWNILEVIKAGLLGDKYEFFRRYCVRFNSRETTEQGKVGLASFLRKTIMIRRRKMDVLPDLPDKIRMKQEIEIDHNRYMYEIQKLYKEIDLVREQLQSATLNDDNKKAGLFELNKKIREMTLQERQIAGLCKAPFVVKYLNELLGDYEEEKFVVFCHHLSVHKIIYDGLFKYNPVQIIGGQTDKQRQEAIDKFQNDKETRVIICGLRAGNLGINLTRAAYVIFAELDWSPSVHLQAEDRLHRIGQKNKVFAHYLEGAGTFDEILSYVLLNKTLIINDVMGEKMEVLNNKKALDYLEDKFKVSDSKKLSKFMDNMSEK